MTATIGNIAFDCDDVMKIATFWSAALGRPLDKGSGELFASIGGTDAARRAPALYFNKVPEPKQAKNRVHIDHKIPGQHWTVMQDPEGNEFCIAAKSFTGWD